MYESVPRSMFVSLQMFNPFQHQLLCSGLKLAETQASVWRGPSADLHRSWSAWPPSYWVIMVVSGNQNMEKWKINLHWLDEAHTKNGERFVSTFHKNVGEK